MTAELEMETPEQNFLNTLKALNTDRLFVHVELERLKVDERYQRKVNEKRVKNLAANYNEDLMGVLICSVRSDGVYVIDGQHRLEVAKLLGHATVRCELRIGLTLEQEASIFYSLDTARIGLNSDDAFRALLVSGDQVALSIKQAIEDAGLLVAESPRQNGVRAFRTLLALEQRFGIEIIRKTLRVLHDAWPDTVNQTPAGLLEGMAHFLNHYPEVNLKELSRTLGVHASSLGLVAMARSISGTLAWNTRKSMAQAILVVYNKQRRGNRLEDRFADNDE